MNARVSSLRLMADRWVERTPPDFSRKRFFQFADDIYTHYPGFAAINWIDASGEICWIFPEDKNAQARDRKPLTHSDPGYRRAFEKAGTGIGEVITPSVELFIGGIGFEVFLPLISDGKLQGYLNGVFRINQIMDTCLAEKILDSFCIKLYEGDRLIYNNENPDAADNAKHLHVFDEVNFFGKTWRLDIGPKAGMYYSEIFRNWPVLIFGLVISMTVFLLLNYLFRRMELYRDARNQALGEITERKKAEETLKKNEKILESLLSELASKNEELETFVYTVSHDLKTPIITIEGFVGALREDFGNLLSADGKTYLNYISDATRKMGLLISDLLDLSRIGRLTENKVDIQFGRLVEEIVAALQPMIREKGIKVTIQQDLPLAYGVERRLRQAMKNQLRSTLG